MVTLIFGFGFFVMAFLYSSSLSDYKISKMKYKDMQKAMCEWRDAFKQEQKKSNKNELYLNKIKDVVFSEECEDRLHDRLIIFFEKWEQQK